MYSARTLNLVWLLLVALTLGGMALGGNAVPGFWITTLIAIVTALKGRLVIDYFMELGGANPTIRRLVRVYALLVPALMLVTFLWAPQIAQLTGL